MTVSEQVAGLKRFLPDGVLAAACPSRVVLDHVTSKWGVLVLVALADRTLRWSELRRAVQGVSEKMLAQTLQTLERDGLVHREARPVIPPHVEYSLTTLGESLVERLLPLMEWLLVHADDIVAGQTGAGQAGQAVAPAAARPAARPEKRQPPRNVPSSDR
jgi:DNA-binding HxlR family transcriptional regulator